MLFRSDFENETLAKIGNRRPAFFALLRQVALRYAGQVESDYKAFLIGLAKPAQPPPTPPPPTGGQAAAPSAHPPS